MNLVVRVILLAIGVGLILASIWDGFVLQQYSKACFEYLIGVGFLLLPIEV